MTEFHAGQSRQFLLHHAAGFRAATVEYAKLSGAYAMERRAHYERLAAELERLAADARDAPGWPYADWPHNDGRTE